MFGTHFLMLGEGGTPLEELVGAIRKYQARAVDPRDDDLKLLRSGLDGLESEFSTMARRAQQSGEHLLDGTATAANSISRNCEMSGASSTHCPRGAARF